jgi:HSP20 family protein
MAIQRWDPVRDLRRLQGQLNRLFDETLAGSTAAESQSARPAAWTPPLDLCEEDGRYVLRADLPGVSPSDVEIEVSEGKLVLSGQRSTEGGAKRESYLRAERPVGRFAVEVALPPSVDGQGIRASQRNGVLELVLPKRSGTAPSRIRVAGE